MPKQTTAEAFPGMNAEQRARAEAWLTQEQEDARELEARKAEARRAVANRFPFPNVARTRAARFRRREG